MSDEFQPQGAPQPENQVAMALPFDVPQNTKTGTCIYSRALPDGTAQQVPTVVLIIEDPTGDKRVTLGVPQALALSEELKMRAEELNVPMLAVPPPPRLLLPGQ